MPTYTYECRNPECPAYSTDPTEIDLSVRDETPQLCLSCRGPLTRILPQSVGVIFKGSGFYSTDNKR